MADVHNYKSSSFDLGNAEALEPQKKSRPTRRKRGAPAGSDSAAAESQDESDYVGRRIPAKKRVRHYSPLRTTRAQESSVASRYVRTPRTFLQGGSYRPSSRTPSEPIIAKSSLWPHIPEVVQTDDGYDGCVRFHHPYVATRLISPQDHTA